MPQTHIIIPFRDRLLSLVREHPGCTYLLFYEIGEGMIYVCTTLEVLELRDWSYYDLSLYQPKHPNSIDPVWQKKYQIGCFRSCYYPAGFSPLEGRIEHFSSTCTRELNPAPHTHLPNRLFFSYGHLIPNSLGVIHE
ncbi:MAG: hypothetical protein WC045_00735 [Patescibacteria group bacterium]